MRRSCLSQSMFFPIVVASLVAGNAFDLIGTYVHQPDLQHEGNPIHSLLRRHGYSPGWPKVIAAKLASASSARLVCASSCAGAVTTTAHRSHRFESLLRTTSTADRWDGSRRSTASLAFVPRFLAASPFGLWAALTIHSWATTIWLGSMAGPVSAAFGSARCGLTTESSFGLFSPSLGLCWDMWRDYQDIHPDDTGVQTEVAA
jgi:hypothetical protein